MIGKTDVNTSCHEKDKDLSPFDDNTGWLFQEHSILNSKCV